MTKAAWAAVRERFASLPLDGWDAVGAAGLVAVTAGIYELAGRPWALIFVGAAALALYVAREARMAMTTRGDD